MIPPATEALRYDYPLTPDSVVIDAGGYEGNFAKTIADRYDCHVHVFEPVMRFANAIKNRLANYPKVRVWPCALGGHGRMETFGVQNDSSGLLAGSTDTETVSVVSIKDVLTSSKEGPNTGLGEISLGKFNVESMEFEIVEALLESGLVTRFKDLQIQWHPIVKDAQLRYDMSAVGLMRTHDLTYNSPWVWQNWRRR